MARVKFSFTDDNGVVLTDTQTNQPHAFDFPVEDQVLEIVEAWNRGQGYKYPNFGELAREILFFHGFMPMLPSEVLEAFDAPVKEAEKQKKAFLFGLFGQVPTS